MTVTEHIREHLLARIFLGPLCDKTEPYESLVCSEWSPEFEQLMRNRLLVGRFRYGRMDDPHKGDYDHITSAIKRLQEYQQNGNTEHLVDVANLCLVEFVCGKHPNKHFDAGDDREAGRTMRANAALISQKESKR